MAKAIETIGVRVVVEGADKAISDLNKFNRAVAGTGKQSAAAASPLSMLGGALANVATIAAGIISAQLINRVAEGIKDIATQAILGAGRVEELEIVMELIGTKAGFASEELFKFRDAIIDTGIRTDVATKLIAQFARRNLDLAQAVELARLAQDAAVFSMEDSSEALDAILAGILRQRSILLRHRGIIVDMTVAMKQYGDSINKAADDLSPAERVQAALNAVLREGASLAGAYEAAMTTASKQIRSMPRFIFELLRELGVPFQQTFADAIFGINEFIKALRVAVSEGGILRPVIDGLASALNRILAPLIAIVRVISGFLTQTNAATAATRDWDVKMADMRRTTNKTTEAVSELGNQWSEEAKKIVKVNTDLGKSITRMWEDHNRRLVRSTFDFNLRRLRQEIDWQRSRERGLEDHNRKMADLSAELEELRTGKRRQEIRAEMKAEQGEFEDQRARFQALLGEAQSEEERLRVQGWLDALQVEHEGQQAVLQEETDALDAEMALVQARIRQEEVAFARRRAREDEDRRIRMAREEEDFARRIARDEEEATRREALQREAAAERIALIQEGIALERAERLKSLQEQEAMLSAGVGEQLDILKGFNKDQQTLVDGWVKTFEDFFKETDLAALFAGEFEDVEWTVIGKTAGEVLMEAFFKTMRGFFKIGKFLLGVQTEVQSFLVLALARAVANIEGKLFKIGQDMIKGLINGIWSMANNLFDTLQTITDHALSIAKNILGIGSYSRVLFQMGQEMSRGLAEGIRSMGDLPALQMGQVTVGALQAVPASTAVTNNEFNLNVTSLSPVEPIVQDFHMLKALAGS